MKNSRLATGLWVALACWACAVLSISALMPDQMPDVAFVLSDKINHFIAYTVGGWLAAGALRASSPLAPVAGRLVVAFVMMAAFGIVDEGLQKFTPGRSGGDIHDWVADCLGALVGVLLTLLTHSRFERLGRKAHTQQIDAER